MRLDQCGSRCHGVTMYSSQIKRLLEERVAPYAKVSCCFKICSDYQLPETLALGHLYVTNLDNEHWVVLYRSMEGNVDYFDPAASEAPPSLKECLEKTHYARNDYNLQKEANDINCGLYCVIYAYCKLTYAMSIDSIVRCIRVFKRSKKWVNCAVKNK